VLRVEKHARENRSAQRLFAWVMRRSGCAC